MQIEHVERPGREWDDFVEATPGATLAHAAAWADILRESYGLEPHFLAARGEGGRLQGVLPLVGFRSLRGVREWISLPFLDTGGVLATSEEAARGLEAAALDLLRRRGGRCLELRGLAAAETEGERESGVDRVDLWLPLEQDEETQWGRLRGKVRNQTRKATKEGLGLREAEPEALLDAFYHPFCVNMRDLGSPVHARSFFAAAIRHFGSRLRLVVAADGARSVGGLVAIHYAQTVSVPWASTLRSERHRCPNNLIYWEALRWSIARGAREFDFGRSPRDAGTHRFKLGWGALERTLCWRRLAADGREIPLPAVREGALLSRLSMAWTRLPVPVATFLGPRIRRFISA